MIVSFLITFRETLEVALIIGIILSYLIQTKQQKYNNIVYVGLAAGLLLSLIGAVFFVSISSGFSGVTEAIFEGILMLVGAALLTSMIFWMMKQKQIAVKLQEKVDTHITSANKVGLFLLVFVSVLREGIETVIFLGAASFINFDLSFFAGAVLGVTAAIILGFIIFVSSVKINIKVFFNVTSILLILFAAGLVAHGTHELQEANIIPILE